MSTLREEFEQKLQALPKPPFFAQLLATSHLSAAQRAGSPYLRTTRLLVVTEIALDRCYEQPGIWLKVVDTRHPPIIEQVNSIGSRWVLGQSVWLNIDWCKVYDRPDASLNLKVN